MVKTELEELRGQKAVYEDQIRDLENEIDDLRSELWELEDCDEGDTLLTESLIDQMKYELLVENWEDLSLEDLRAICRKT